MDAQANLEEKEGPMAGLLVKIDPNMIQTSVTFSCTRVKEANMDDYKELAWTMKYLRGTLYLPPLLEMDSSGSIQWWVDGAFAVHENMKSYTGGMMSLGKGAAYATSTWQKLHTKSSTEAELVTMDDVMPQIIWTRNFLEAANDR